MSKVDGELQTYDLRPPASVFIFFLCALAALRENFIFQ